MERFDKDGLLMPTEALGRRFVVDAAHASAGQLALSRRRAAAAASIERQGFRIGNLCLLTPYERVSELTEMMPIYRVPNTAAWLHGLANLHGNLVPVADLGELLGVVHQRQAKTMLLVLGQGENAVAVIIDGLPVRHKLAKQDQVHLPAMPQALHGFVTGAYTKEAQVWLEFDHERFFDAMANQIAA